MLPKQWIFLAVISLVSSLASSALAATPMPGDTAPDFELIDQNMQTQALRNYAGKWVVLYFYPKDDTPGCTEEACNFRDDWAQLQQMGVAVLGVSLDDVASHKAFAEKYHLPFPLLADLDGSTAKAYGAKALLWAKRYTFIINPDGKIAETYLKVDPKTHSREVIAALKGHMSTP